MQSEQAKAKAEDKSIRNVMDMIYNENRFEEAEKILEEKLETEKNPKIFQICLYYLGKCYFSLQKYSEVIRVYLKFIESRRIYLSLKFIASVGCRFKEVADLLETQEFNGKKEQLNKISLLLNCRLDRIYDKLLDLALKILIPVSKDVKNIKPEWTFCIIGDIYLHKNQFEKAKACYDKGLEYKSDDFYLRKGLGDYFLKIGDPQNAETEYHLALFDFDQNMNDIPDEKRALAQNEKEKAEANLKIISGK